MARTQPWWIGWRLVALLIVGVHVVGTAGYVLIEGWSAWDAFYMTVITVTTVGYGEVHPLSPAGRAFTVVILLTGVGAFFYAFTLFMTLLAEGGLVERRERKRLARMLDNLVDHFIVCGFGRMGEIIAHEFARQKVPFVVIERNPERMHLAIEQGFLAVEADASNEEVLRRIGIARARGFVAAVSTDAENVYAVLSARLLNPNLFIVGRAETEDSRTKLMRAGADRVISPYQLGGLQLAQTALRPAVVDFVQLATSSENMDLNLEQVHITEGSSLAGRSLIDAGLRQRFGVVVVGIRRADGHMDFNPEPETSMRAGDDLVVLGRAESLKDLETAATER
ncbi:MAG TPA: potassium channel protein [Vicinamibacterales bacterium]|nr:potassium channel protein [Vicinamibacterales bacterium]